MKTAKHKPELLSPAGDWPSLSAAIENGADSVYFGIKKINMRHQASNFDLLELPKIMNLLHRHYKKGYLALNVIIKNKELAKVKQILTAAKEAKVDAIILWDLAVLAIAREMGLNVHISTQASVANIHALEQYAQLGAQRVILARECTLFDIRQMIKKRDHKNLTCEIESFIHGAMCVSVSGRCFMSLWSHNKSANKGACTQPCRREYFIQDRENEVQFVLGQDYILSPKDLCTIDFFDALMESEIDSFKIEGRMRSPEYIKITTAVYRKAIDAYAKGKWNQTLAANSKEQLKTVYNRGFSSGFYFGRPQEPVSRSLGHLYEKVYVGDVTRFFKKIQVAELKVKAMPLSVGATIIFIGKTTPASTLKIKEMQVEHRPIQQACKGQSVGIKLPFVVKPRDKVFIWKEKKV
ncbi:MAG: U32 family peptidase [Candidatus Omnitrophica bacterium]|nr:U32 family peptidase [Candidatus Omnitrophota bacterium]